MLPAVLQAEGEAPCFGTICGISEQGLAFSFQTAPLSQRHVGALARLDFDLMGLHHACKGLIVHLQNKRALLSLRETPTNVRAALQSINQDSLPTLASRLSTQQVQQACHAHFMAVMQRVVAQFYAALPHAIEARSAANGAAQAPLALLGSAMASLRAQLVRHFTAAYPMYPEQLDLPLHATSDNPADPADMARVDEWIRRTTIAQQVAKSLDPLPETFSRHYGGLVNAGHTRTPHPYHPDAVLQLLSALIDPLHLSATAQTVCYELMAEAFAGEARALYEALLGIVRDAPASAAHPAWQDLSLEQWLRTHAGEAPAQPQGDARALDEFAALLGRLAASLEAGGTDPAADDAAVDSRATGDARLDPTAAAGERIAALLARDRIFGRFVPADALVDGSPAARGGSDSEAAALLTASAADGLSVREPAPGQTPPRVALGGLADLDQAALQGLVAAMRQQTPLELAPDRPAQGSQIQALMLQAQSLLLEYTLNGLTYRAEPDHPAWTLLNSIDALHRGADPDGRFLDAALHQAVSLTMQWLLGQRDIDAALRQVNALLAPINAQLDEARADRRARALQTLDAVAAEASPFRSGWCLVHSADRALPYEVLGLRDGAWTLVDRSATDVLTLPADALREKIELGELQDTCRFDLPFLTRIADATLAAGLHAVHVYTWQDPASGCLKRSALIDELERRLLHPVTEPPLYCALIEIPTMRPGRAELPGDELAILQKHTGERLLAALESGEHCGRLSDVSFMMIFAPQAPSRLAERLERLKTDMEALHPVWKISGAVVPLADGASGQSPSLTLRRANLACAPAREAAALDLSCLHRATPAPRIETLPYDDLYLRCQKIAPCDAKAPAHYEVLLGIDSAQQPAHTPQSFVVMAEQTGLAHDLDAWVLGSALEWMDRQADRLEQLSGLSVNLSGNSLTHAGQIDTLLKLLARYPHLASKLILEVTETAAIDNLDVAVRSLRQLRQRGCRIALDDFGSGYSSYSYIRSLPLDYLKIDGTYIRNVLTDATDQALTASMVDVAHALGLKVIAEYVDSEGVYAWLKDIGVDYVQGYWVHEPERLDGLVLN